MKSIELLEKLKNRPIFKVQDIERIAHCSREYAKLTLNRLKERKLIKSVTKNAYTTKSSIFVIASNILYPSYISFWSAAYFLGYTEQIVNTIQVAATIRAKPIDFEGYKIEFMPMKHFFGYKKIKTDDGELFIVEDEKLLIDSFLRPELCGNFDEIEKIFENAKISTDKLVLYLKKANSQVITKKVGFLLEKTKNTDISGSFDLDKNYALLNPFSKRWSKINSKWRVRI